MSSPKVPPGVTGESARARRRRRGSKARRGRRDPLQRYTRYLLSQIEPFLKGRICEVGSGTGQMTQYLAAHELVTALEPQGPAHLLALQRFAYQLNIRCVRAAIEDCPNAEVPARSFDTVWCVNLLEHLEYDITALEIMGDLLSDTGHVVVVVPAYNALYGNLDYSRGHLRRFNRRTLAEAFDDAGLAVTTSRYFNAPALLGWYWLSCILRRREISARTAGLFDRLVPLIARMERHISLPFGHSLLMVGRRR